MNQSARDVDAQQLAGPIVSEGTFAELVAGVERDVRAQVIGMHSDIVIESPSR
jgi:hypothetical protein